MPNEQWVNLAKYSAEPPAQGVEAQWQESNRAKVDKMFAQSDLEKTKLRKMVRSGVPDGIRGQVYARLLKLESLAEYEKNYEVALTRTHGAVIPAEPLPPTFGGRLHRTSLALTPTGNTVVEHVLCIISHDFPNLEYCPFVPACVALLAHHMQSEDELLGATVAIVKRSMAKQQTGMAAKKGEDSWAYFPTYRKEVKFLLRAFGNLVHQYNKKLHLKLTELHETSPEPVWAAWLTGMFIDVLPQPALWRMLDCFLLEGYKALFRFGLGMLLLQRDALMLAPDLASVRLLASPDSPALTPSAALCKAADGVSINKADVRNVQTHHRTLASISTSDDIHEAHYRFQRGLPKIVVGSAQEETVSSVLNDEHWVALWSWIPPSKRVEALELVFTTKEHGTHISNLFRRSEGRFPLIVVIGTTDGAVFGAYLSHPFPSPGEKTGDWYGNGETFLFTMEPYAKLYPWIGRSISAEAYNTANDSPDAEGADSSPNGPSIEYVRDRASMFIMISDRSIHVGGGGAGTGLVIDQMLTGGHTSPCQTFENANLTGTKETRFESHVLEVFAFSRS
ncbi:hypothetical protein HDU90_004572 [Geranomyces variabilis]|nr:hypothetical protein HDU90_004572 [Geranomyces variabilis]